jgi:hypothetical protein
MIAANTRGGECELRALCLMRLLLNRRRSGLERVYVEMDRTPPTAVLRSGSGCLPCDELKQFKQSPANAQRATAEMSWSKKEFLVRLGGCYAGGMSVAVALSNKPAIWLRRTDDELLLLSFQLRSDDGSVHAEMEDTMFEADPSRLYDLETNTGGTRLKFWLARRNIGLDVSFKRATMAELSAILEADRRRAEQDFEQKLPADVREMIRDARSQSAGDWFRTLPSFQQLPEGIREAHLSGDPTGTFVKGWATRHCLDDEQKVPLLNFESLVLFSGGRRIVIRNGIGAEGYKIGYSTSVGNAAGGINL